ncbi:hypothetical protein GQ55_4G103200 [Panicum hallii var. hallii]|uniref:Uncharacterized protein n=1 Tax=Panicum hallii var. hallii TaxID=1504633 RepID=A0A2T7DX76_9POAL|nr:hypothetical protein GQ55_4G103200 [Panicum hallii var. hallii]
MKNKGICLRSQSGIRMKHRPHCKHELGGCKFETRKTSLFFPLEDIEGQAKEHQRSVQKKRNVTCRKERRHWIITWMTNHVARLKQLIVPRSEPRT